MAYKWITAFDLENWTNSEPRRAQELLPLLIRKLIVAVTSEIISFNFPSGNSIQYSGYDGTLDVANGNRFIPQGYSVWEFGTDENILSKFNGDYEKRTETSLGIDKINTTFIFVTSRVWGHKKSITNVISEKKSSNKWKNIIILDANSIEAWLDECPAVAVWLSSVINKPHGNLLTLEDFWNNWANTTKPKLTEGFFLAGREEQYETIKKWLSVHNDNLFLRSDSQEEAILMFISVVLSMDNNSKETIISRCLIINDLNTWNQIISCENENRILIPYFRQLADIRLPQNIIAIIPMCRYDFREENKTNIIDILKQNKRVFGSALENIGIKSTEIHEYITKTKRNFLALYRLLTILPNRRQPRWINKFDIMELIPILLVGGWSDKKFGDKEIISKIASCSYDEYIKKINKWLTLEDSPIIKVGDNYQLVSVYDMWNYLWDFISKVDFERFKESVLFIFAIRDPKFELEEDKWHAASIYGKELEYSRLLRESIIISMIMFSTKDTISNNFGSMSIKNDIDYLIKQIFDSVDDWRGWYTIAPFIPLFSEASPESILAELENQIEKYDNDFWKMFNKPNNVIFGESYYTNILWALEKLVWNREYAFRAIIVLIKILERKFEYKLVNSPLNSLYEIFCIWHPQSALTLYERMDVLEYLINNHCDATWKLLIKMLPDPVNNVCGNIQKNKWLDCNENTEIVINDHDIYEQNKVITSLLIKNVTPISEKWCLILDKITAFSESIDKIVNKLLEQNILFTYTDRIEISDKLRNIISQHRHFLYAKWSMEADLINKLEVAYKEIEPKDTRIKYKYLFSCRPSLLNPHIFNEAKDYDFEAEEKMFDEARKKALIEINLEYGIEGIIQALSSADDNYKMGIILAENIFHFKLDWNIIKSLKLAKRYSIVSALLCHIYKNKGILYISSFIKNEINCLNNKEISDIFCMLPFTSEVWEEVSKQKLDIINEYWCNVNVLGILNLEYEDLHFVIDKLLMYNRPYTVMESIAHSKFSDSKKIIEIMEKGIQIYPSSECNGLNLSRFQPYTIMNLFEKIYNDKNINNERIAKLELEYLAFFRYEGEPRCLIKEISNNPELFIELVCAAYTDKNKESNDLSEKMRQIAENAFNVLDMFKTVPGADKNNIDSNYFNHWMTEALNGCRVNNRGDIGESIIGKIISYSPIGNDNIWPHQEVRMFLEKHGTSIMIDSFIIAKTNQRGVHTVSGGEVEKRIAKEYNSNAEKIKFSYPKTCMILKRLRDCYINDAKRDELYEEMDYWYWG